jgi:hypothetical protein
LHGVRTSNAIQKVIESCLDDERTLFRQSKLVDEQRRAVLVRLADERRRFSEELERFSGPIGRGHLGSWRALARELGDELWARAMGRNPHDAIDACRRSQHRADVRYEQALELEWPGEVKAALDAQHARVHAARLELSKIEY